MCQRTAIRFRTCSEPCIEWNETISGHSTCVPSSPAGASKIDAATGVYTGVTQGPGGNALGITVDPVTKNVVYVHADCRSTGTCTIVTLDPATGTSSNFAVLPGSVANFIDGIQFDPKGDYLFLSIRSPSFRLGVLDRTGAVVQLVPMTSEPDGISFHATAPKFVITNNTDGTITRFDFPGDNYALPPTQSVFASGGFRGDLSQVGPDGCVYITQGGTRYDNGVVSGQNSLVIICGGFAPARASALVRPRISSSSPRRTRTAPARSTA